MAGQAKTEDKRDPRRRVALMRANVIVPASGVVAACIVRDFCSSGAKIELDQPQDLPTVFWLKIDGDGTLHYCTAKWRSRRQTGVEFTRARLLRAAEAEVSSLRRRMSWRNPVL